MYVTHWMWYSSCPVAIGNALIDMYNEIQNEISDDEVENAPQNESAKNQNKNSESKIKLKEKITPKCPECGGSLIFEGGCNTCKDCGWSKCD